MRCAYAEEVVEERVIVCSLSAFVTTSNKSFDLRVNGCPVAVDFSGVARESARLRNSEVVFAC